MKNIIYLICASLLITRATQAEFKGSIEEIPVDIKKIMIGCSWKPECPVPLEDLRYLTASHWGYDDKEKIGHMVVHSKLADELLAIFYELYQEHFPIERIELIDLYDANDELSMTANNSSAFCCRAITNVPGTFSLHSYGSAIDINPLVNPYVKGTQILPRGWKNLY
jgi:D-alanyl-D-alanine carboxypeptidase